VTSRIAELIELKATISESYLHEGESELILFMKGCLVRAETESKQLPAGKGEMKDLNEFFRNTLRK
jgi:hypothetical protein